MKTVKFKHLKVIQQHYGQGWEDVSEYETDSAGNPKETHGFKMTKGRMFPVSLLQHDLKEYQLTGYPTRVIRRKEILKPVS